VRTFEDNCRTVEEVHQRAELSRNQPKLANHLEKDCEAKKRNDRIFGGEIRWDEVPASQERWTVGPFPTFTKDQLFQYASPKLPGRKSMLEKGERFFNSRKVRVQPVDHHAIIQPRIGGVGLIF